MTRFYWYKPCPVCDGQGRLRIFRDVTHDAPYLHCEECESGFRDPEEASDPNASFLTLDEDFDYDVAGLEAIERYGWSRYALHRSDEDLPWDGG